MNDLQSIFDLAGGFIIGFLLVSVYQLSRSRTKKIDKGTVKLSAWCERQHEERIER